MSGRVGRGCGLCCRRGRSGANFVLLHSWRLACIAFGLLEAGAVVGNGIPVRSVNINEFDMETILLGIGWLVDAAVVSHGSRVRISGGEYGEDARRVCWLSSWCVGGLVWQTCVECRDAGQSGHLGDVMGELYRGWVSYWRAGHGLDTRCMARAKKVIWHSQVLRYIQRASSRLGGGKNGD